jgi:hypothetical protein
LQKGLFGHLTFSGCAPIWEWKLSRALRLRELGPELEICGRLQFQRLAELSSAKGIVNDWLTVTNWVPHVNDEQGQSRLPKDSNSPWLRTDYLWIYGQQVSDVACDPAKADMPPWEKQFSAEPRLNRVRNFAWATTAV